ncbi:MAG: hypothetical protein HY043_23615 [Verrucomicrobia bacterium]|nr:hypothetical protein [Verrucomicrobiota bacterium]
MIDGESLTRATAWIAFVLYASASITQLMARGETALERRARWLWSFGLSVYLLHVASAFQFYHHWSHFAAYVATARQTTESSGLNWGGGIYFNYFFSAAWLGEVAWSWLACENYRRRPAVVGRTIHAFFAFMWFNAAVVFAKGGMRWFGLSVFILLALVWWQLQRRRIRAAASEPSQRTSS